MYNRTNATWQEAPVTAYLTAAEAAHQLPAAGSFSKLGRATPDVAVLGEGYQVITGGNQTSIFGGTSASAPVFAALVALLNEARIQKGMPQLGFLNPWMYQNTALFTDIVEGDNMVGRGGEKLAAGWRCTEGWDPVSGLGTPNFQKMLVQVLQTKHTPSN